MKRLIIVRYIQLRRERNLLRKLCDRLAEELQREQERTESLALNLHRCEREQGDLHAQLKALDEVAESELAELRAGLAAAERERDTLHATCKGLQRERNDLRQAQLADHAGGWGGDLDDLQGFIDVVADGARQPVR